MSRLKSVLTHLETHCVIDDVKHVSVYEFHEKKVVLTDNFGVMTFTDQYANDQEYVVLSDTKDTTKELFIRLLSSRVYSRKDFAEFGELEGDMYQDDTLKIIEAMEYFFDNQLVIDVLNQMILNFTKIENYKLHPECMLLQLYYSALYSGKATHKYNLMDFKG